MMFEYRMFIFDDPLLILWPTLALATTVFFFQQAGDR
jgi:ABC-type dipeptide/oligopeptide/nickel transport system permease subunit